MRITNTMMTKQTMNNVAKSKRNLAEIENQMSTEKSITRPSDNPIVAIRALSLRSSLSEINQYLEHNIPDAESWLRITEGALDDMDGILSDIYQYCTQGASDQFTVTDRNAIIEVLQQYKDALYSGCNTNFSDRYIFSGYKTDTSFTFETAAEAKKKYSITQTFQNTDFDQVEVMKNSVDATTIAQIPASATPETEKYYRLRLAYGSCENAASLTLNYDAVTDAQGNVTYNSQMNLEGITKEGLEAMITTGNGIPAGKAYYVYDTGEIVLADDVYESMRETTGLSVTYEKDGFLKGDVRPEMYFNCRDITDPANAIDYTHRDQENISYTVNFSQSLQVNTRGCDTLSYDVGRDIDDMCNALRAVSIVEGKIAKIKEMKNSGLYTNQEKELDSMLEAANKEHDYALNYMESIFSKEMKRVKGYQATVDLQLADLGARETRLKLTKSRITEQQTTFSELKSSNEDIDLEDAVIGYSSATTLYQAALTAAADTVKKSLLDYI